MLLILQAASFFTDTEKQIEKKFKRAMTDSDTVIAYDVKEKPGVSNLLGIQSAITGKSIEDIVASYEGKMYGHLKVETAEIVNTELSPIKEKIDELMSDRTELEKILDKGAEKARDKASKTIKEFMKESVSNILKSWDYNGNFRFCRENFICRNNRRKAIIALNLFLSKKPNIVESSRVFLRPKEIAISLNKKRTSFQKSMNLIKMKNVVMFFIFSQTMSF